MTFNTFLESILYHYEEQLPFVIYSKPKSTDVLGLLQEDNKLHSIKSFEEKGFVFAPFDDNESSVIIPFESSKSIASSIENIDTIESNSTIKQAANNQSEHEQLVAKAVETINNSSLEKVVLSRIEEIELEDFNLDQTLKSLFSTNTLAFRYCWFHPKVGMWIGATPETLCKIQNKRVETMSLAGTQLFKGTLDVKWESKEKEEQQYVTDFIVENLKPITASISTSKTETVKAGNLLHLRTKISGLMHNESDLKQIIRTLHPTPAVCGYPKDLAKDYILKNENYNRTFYTGFIGELNKAVTSKPRTSKRNIELRAYETTKNTSQLFVNLRCMQIKDNSALIYVGGGITKDSNPKKEWLETVNKTQTIKSILHF